MTFISWSRLCYSSSTFTGFNLLSRPQGDVVTSFAAHLFSSGRNLNSLLQLMFLPPTFIPGRDLKVMSRPLFLLPSSSSGRDLSEWSRHRLWSLINKWLPLHSSCWDSNSHFYVATSNGAFHLKTSCNFVLLQRLLLWPHLQIHVATSY